MTGLINGPIPAAAASGHAQCGVDASVPGAFRILGILLKDSLEPPSHNATGVPATPGYRIAQSTVQSQPHDLYFTVKQFCITMAEIPNTKYSRGEVQTLLTWRFLAVLFIPNASFILHIFWFGHMLQTYSISQYWLLYNQGHPAKCISIWYATLNSYKHKLSNFCLPKFVVHKK